MLVGVLLGGVGALGGGLLGDVDEVEEEELEEEEEEEEVEEEETARIASSKEPTAVVCSHPDLPSRTTPDIDIDSIRFDVIWCNFDTVWYDLL